MKDVAIRLLDYFSIEDNVRDLKNRLSFTPPDVIKDFIRRFYDLELNDLDYQSKIEGLFNRDIQTLDISEVYTYITGIIRIDRMCGGFIYQNIEDGTMQKLLKRYLELEESV